jgi:inhibitor of cysteine peptidase
MKLSKMIIGMISATALSGCSGSLHSPIKLENDHDCKPLYVKVGQKIMLALDSNPSTGYAWLLANQPQFLTLLDSQKNAYQNQPTDGRVGQPIKSIWYYQVNAKGTGQLQFNYQRPWQQEILPDAQFNCQIISR